VVKEASVLAAKPREQRFPDPADDLATALARIDLAAAMKLLEGRAAQPYDLTTIRTGIANRIAATDPAEARRILGMLDENRQPLARRGACLRMAVKDLPAARALAAEDHDAIVESLLPAIAAQNRWRSDPAGAQALLREAVERLAKLGEGQSVSHSPAVALARLLPLAVRIDPDRAPDYLWLALSQRAPLSALPEAMPMLNQTRQHYLDLAELAVLVARYDRPAAEAVFAPVADRLVGLSDEHWGLGNEGPAIFRAAGAFDARVARTLLEGLPEDPAPPPGSSNGAPTFRHRSKAQARIALATILGLSPGIRLRELFLRDGDEWFGDFED
jgi:hypothetical protein